MAWTFEIPAGVRFTCTQCGNCCRAFDVPLGPGERERLGALDWAGRADDLVGAETFVRSAHPEFRGRFRLARREGGACVYLGDRNQCRIHEHFGGDVKPLACRLYPFGFHPMGDRVGVDVSFSCRSIGEGSGAPLDERVPEWLRLVGERGAAHARPPRLTRSQPLSADLLWEIEHHLLAFLKDGSLPLVDRVRCAFEFLRLATTGDPATPAAAVMRASMAHALPARMRREPQATGMDDTQRVVFFQWLFVALNPLPAGWYELPAREREREDRSRRRDALSFRDGVGRPRIDNVEMSATFADVPNVDATLLRGDCSALATYMCAKIVGQRFLGAPPDELPLVDAARLLLLCHPMIAWTARCLAADRSSPSVEEADVRRAIGLVDRTVGQLVTARLPRKQARAFEWVMQETDLVSCALRDVLG